VSDKAAAEVDDDDDDVNNIMPTAVVSLHRTYIIIISRVAYMSELVPITRIIVMSARTRTL